MTQTQGELQLSRHRWLAVAVSLW